MRRTVLAFTLLLCAGHVGNGTPQDAPQDKPQGEPQGQPPVKPDLEPHELEKAIAEAITKGVEWLKKRQKPDGSFGDTITVTYTVGTEKSYTNRPGNTALSLLTLLKSDVPPNDPAITKGFKLAHEYLAKKGNLRSNYDRGIMLMAMEALYEATLVHKMKKDGEKVTERAGDFKEPKYSLSGLDAGVAAGIVKELTTEQTKKGGWRYGSGFSISGCDEDISATQIVLLGLKSATRMKLVVPPGNFFKAMDFIMNSQEKDGLKMERPPVGMPTQLDPRKTYVSNGEDRVRGWAYVTKSDLPHETLVTGSMTCAGIGGLLICKSALGTQIPPKINLQVEQSIYDGFAWLTKNWTLEWNPLSARGHFYYLYGIERVGTMGLYEQIGSHLWFNEGSQVLVKKQAPDGHWTDLETEPADLYATCFALLFLKLGTVSIGNVMTGPRTQ